MIYIEHEEMNNIRDIIDMTIAEAIISGVDVYDEPYLSLLDIELILKKAITRFKEDCEGIANEYENRY